jgi:hypothetical protein
VTDGCEEPQNRDVTMTNEQLVLRSPGWVRALGVVFPVAWVYPFFANPELREDFLVPGGVIAVLVVAFVVRTVFCSVIGTADGRLTVRNGWSTRTFVRGELDGAGIDRANGRGWAVFLLLTDGSRHRLDVTEVPFLGPFLGKLERDAAAVREWVDGRPRSLV